MHGLILWSLVNTVSRDGLLHRLVDCPVVDARIGGVADEAVINTYRLRKERRATAMLPSEVRQELIASSTAAGKLLKRLFELDATQPVDMVMSFAKEVQALRSVELSLKLLADDVEPETKDQDAYKLVSTLAGIMFEFAGKAMTRSGKSGDIIIFQTSPGMAVIAMPHSFAISDFRWSVR
jgi:hypothetical protein